MSDKLDIILGAEKDPEDSRDYLLSTKIDELEKNIKTIPNVVDWESTMTPVKNQGSLGSCVAFAVCAVKEWQEKKQHKTNTDKSKEYDLSEQWLYYKCKEIDIWPNFQGTSFRFAMKVLSKDGIPVEQGWSYDPSFKGKPEQWAVNVANWYKCGSYWRISNLEEFKIILEGGPQAIGIMCFDEIFAPDKNGVVALPKNRKNVRGGHAICLSGDTKISLLNGSSKTIKDLFLLNKPFWVYSCDKDKNIVPALAHSVRLTGHKEVLKINLDNGESFKCTKDHLVMKRDGSYVEAQFLTENDSLMPLYKKLSDSTDYVQNYEKVFNPRDGKWFYTHKIVADNSYLPVVDKDDSTLIYCQDFCKKIIHHRDFNKANNSPDNLCLMSGKDHFIYHAQFSSSEKGRKMCRERALKQWCSEDFRNKMLFVQKSNGKKVSERLVREKRCGFQANPEIARGIGKITGKVNIKFCNTSESHKKSKESWKKRYLTDESFKDKVKQISTKNLDSYNKSIKNGKVFTTDKQISARKKNAQLIWKELTEKQKLLKTLKTTYNRFYKKDYSCFEFFVVDKIGNYSKNREVISDIIQLVNPYNHKVVSIESAGFEDVYDITVEKTHNFALECGVFVHNCAVGYDDEKGLIKFKNSWGNKWGINGYGFISYEYFNRFCLDAWYFSDTEILSSVKDQEIPPLAPNVEEVKMKKVKLFNNMNQLQVIHIVKDGVDTNLPVMPKQMATIKADEMTQDVKNRINKDLLEIR